MQLPKTETKTTTSTRMDKTKTDWDSDEVQAQYNKIKQDLQLLKPLIHQVRRIRTLILDTFASNPISDLAQLGGGKENENPVAQGGQVITDIEIIKEQRRIENESDDPDSDSDFGKAAQWEEVFKELYTIPFEYADDILSADKELIHTLNFHADLLTLSEWQDHDNWEMYYEWTDTIISEWLAWVDGGKVPSECPFSKGSFTRDVLSWLRDSWWEAVSIGASNLPFSDRLTVVNDFGLFVVRSFMSLGNLTLWPVFK